MTSTSHSLNEMNKATQLGDTYWLYVVWDPLGRRDPEPPRICNPAKHLAYVKREVIAARYYDIPAEAIEQAARAPHDARTTKPADGALPGLPCVLDDLPEFK